MTIAKQAGDVNSRQSLFSGRRGRHIREALQAYLFLFPGTLILFAFNILPIGYALYISMHKWRIRKGNFIGLGNYFKALGNPLDILFGIGGLLLLGASWVVWRKITSESSGWTSLLGAIFALMLIIGGLGLILGLPRMIRSGDKGLFQSLLITFYYSLGTVPLQIILSFFLANILFQDIRGKTLWRIIYFLPYITVTVASAAVWQSIYDPGRGFLNLILVTLGFPAENVPRWLFDATPIGIYLGHSIGIDVPNWAGGPSLAMVSIMIYNIWTFVGYNAVIYLAGLGNIPHALYESAKIDGANRWDLLRHITLPLVSPTTYFLVMMGVLGTFRAFNHIYVMTRVAGPVGAPQGTTMTTSMLIWKNFWSGNRFGYASALAFILMGVTLSLTWIQKHASEGSVFYG